jgi:hypothetical protein
LTKSGGVRMEAAFFYDRLHVSSEHQKCPAHLWSRNHVAHIVVDQISGISAPPRLTLAMRHRF